MKESDVFGPINFGEHCSGGPSGLSPRGTWPPHAPCRMLWVQLSPWLHLESWETSWQKNRREERMEVWLGKQRSCKHSSDMFEKRVVMSPTQFSSSEDSCSTCSLRLQKGVQSTIGSGWGLSLGWQLGVPCCWQLGVPVTISLVTALVLLSSLFLFPYSPILLSLFSSPSISVATSQYQ